MYSTCVDVLYQTLKETLAVVVIVLLFFMFVFFTFLIAKEPEKHKGIIFSSNTAGGISINLGITY